MVTGTLERAATPDTSIGRTIENPNNATLTMVLLVYRKAFQNFHFGYASAIAWVLFVIILFFSLIVIRSSDRWVYYEGGVRR